MPVEVYEPFLYIFVTISLKQLPKSYTIFTEWLMYQTEQKEKQKEYFPHNAIRFANMLSKLLSSNKPTDNKDLMRITNRLEVLKILETLKSNFGICVSIKDASKVRHLLTIVIQLMINTYNCRIPYILAKPFAT